MARPRKGDVEITYVEIGLSDGVRWRIDPRMQSVQEIHALGGELRASRSVSLHHFESLIADEQKRRRTPPEPHTTGKEVGSDG